MTGDVLEETEVESYSYASDSNHVVYLADQETEDVREVYVSYWHQTAARAWRSYVYARWVDHD